jgi:chromosome partitioning protein
MSDLPPETGANDGSALVVGSHQPSGREPFGGVEHRDATDPDRVQPDLATAPAFPGDRPSPDVPSGDDPAVAPTVDRSEGPPSSPAETPVDHADREATEPAVAGTSPAEPTAPPIGAPDSDAPAGPVPEVPEPVPAGSSGRSSVSGRPLPRVIAIANQKGGVGKTTTTVNMGAALAELDYRTLVIDLDPQGNATTGLGINYRTLDHTMYDVLLHDVPLEDCIEPTEVRNLFVAPASLDLAGAEIELVPAFSRESRLKRAIEDILDDYDYILIDCPPSLGLLTVNGLVAATEVMVPIQCEYYALEGLAQLTRNVELVRTNLNPKLEISGIVLVMYDSRTRLAEQVVTEVRAHFGSKVCRNMIPRNIRLSEAPSFGQPITTFDPSSRGAVAYRELAREVSGGA